MKRAMIFGLGAALTLGAAGLAWSQTAPARPAPNDYGKEDTWLCRPGRSDACNADQTATVVAADGTLTVEPFKRAADPGVDCFYVYPTVSNDPGGNSDMSAGGEELFVASAQFARFSSVCRPFAPMYRQMTLASLRARVTGQATDADWTLAYGDVKAAWEWYLAHENHGQGVILIGHSQGALMLQKLIADEIDGKPASKLMISAMLIGTSVPLREGRFGSIPLCTAESQTGCLISYASFRDTAPPPATSLFGVAREGGATAACTNPAALGGGKGNLSSYLWARPRGGLEGGEGRPWTKDKTVATPWVATPGLMSSECLTRDGHSYLSIHVNADPADPRVDEISGDVVVFGRVDPNWGLHLIDMNLAMGDLVRIAASESAAWKAVHK